MELSGSWKISQTTEAPFKSGQAYVVPFPERILAEFSLPLGKITGTGYLNSAQYYSENECSIRHRIFQIIYIKRCRRRDLDIFWEYIY